MMKGNIVDLLYNEVLNDMFVIVYKHMFNSLGVYFHIAGNLEVMAISHYNMELDNFYD